MFLLDTDTVIFSLKGNPAVRVNIQRHVHDPLKISVITFMGLYYGAFKSQQPTAKKYREKVLDIWKIIWTIMQTILSLHSNSN